MSDSGLPWVDALQALLDLVVADAVILDLLDGPHVWELSEEREARIPSIAYTLITDDQEENVDPFLVQWTLFADPETIVPLERRLRQLVVSRADRTVGGVRMRMIYQGGRGHPSPREGARQRSFDVRYEPARRR